MQPQAEDHWEPPEAGRAPGEPSPGAFGGPRPRWLLALTRGLRKQEDAFLLFAATLVVVSHGAGLPGAPGRTRLAGQREVTEGEGGRRRPAARGWERGTQEEGTSKRGQGPGKGCRRGG